MKKAIWKQALALSILIGAKNHAHAQIGLSIHGTAANTTISKKKVRPGGGIGLKFFATPLTAIGVSAKYIRLRYEESENAGKRIETTGSLLPVTFTLDQYLSKGFLRPYIGAEAGFYIRNTEVKHNGKKLTDSDARKFGATPKAGITFAFGNLGVFVEGNYHFIFGSKNGSVNTGSLGNISYKNADKLWAVNAGLVFGLPN